jgi:large subunit ribosomal protein L25
MHVPLHFLGEQESNGVKNQGGVVSHNRVEVEVECLPKDLPEFIAVDASKLSVGDSIHLSQLTLPAGVKLVELLNFDNLSEEERHEIDQPVFAIHHPRVEKTVDEESEAGAAATPATPAAPEGKTP